jgi:hypothetical protein
MPNIQTTHNAAAIIKAARLGIELVPKDPASARNQFEHAEHMCAEHLRKQPFPPYKSKRNGETSPSFSQSLERGLEILECFNDPKVKILGVSELAERTGMACSTVHRYVSTLVRMGYITQESCAGRRYRPTWVEV